MESLQLPKFKQKSVNKPMNMLSKRLTLLWSPKIILWIKQQKRSPTHSSASSWPFLMLVLWFIAMWWSFSLRWCVMVPLTWRIIGPRRRLLPSRQRKLKQLSPTWQWKRFPLKKQQKKLPLKKKQQKKLPLKKKQQKRFPLKKKQQKKLLLKKQPQ